MNFRLAGILCLAVTGCGGNNGPIGYASADLPKMERGEPMTLSKTDIEIAQSGLRRIMKDPDSTKFLDFTGAKISNGAIGICGFVNSKNSLGGYTGPKPFIGKIEGSGKKQFVLTLLAKDETDSNIVSSFCVQQGTPIQL